MGSRFANCRQIGLGVRAHLRQVRSTWDGQGSWIGCKVYIEGRIVKKASLAVGCKVQEFGILFWRQWRTTEGFWAEGQPNTVLQREQPGVRTGWMEMERDWPGNGVEFWGEAVVWSSPSYCPKARTINFISLGQFPPVKSKRLGQVVLFSSGLV